MIRWAESDDNAATDCIRELEEERDRRKIKRGGE